MSRLPMWRRYQRLLGPNIQEDVEDELNHHLEMRTADLIARGMDPETARREARRRFGDLSRVRQACEEVNHSSVSRTRRRDWWAGVGQDLRYSLRSLRKNPAFSMVAVITLALGIGATTAVFSVVNGVVLKPAPYPDADRLAYIAWDWGAGGGPAVLSPLRYQYVRDRSRSFEGVTTFKASTQHLGSEPTGAAAHGLRVSEDFFRVLKVRPALGRPFTAEESKIGGPNVVMLGHALWRDRFGGSPSMVGRDVLLDGTTHTVVGVLPPDFEILEALGSSELITPLRLQVDPQDGGQNYLAIARLAPGVSESQAAAELLAITEDFRRDFPDKIGDRARFRLSDYNELFVGDLQGRLWLFLGAVSFVLLISCVNVANLSLARASDRRRELAVRAAMGAGRGRILRQLLTESVVLALLGGALGLLVGASVLRGLLSLIPEALPRTGEIGLDGRVLAFTFLVACVTGILFGLAAALPILRSDLTKSLKDGARGAVSGRGRLRAVLVASESAIAMVLLAGAGLLLAGFVALRSLDPGFRTDGVLTVAFDAAPQGYDADRLWSLQSETLEQIRSIPGVQAAATASNRPLERGWNIPMTAEGSPDAGEVEFRAASPEYFSTLEIPVTRGRAFLPTDESGASPIIIVNEAFAQRYWPGEDPIGKQVEVGIAQGQPIASDWSDPPRTVVGVVADMKEIGLDQAARRTIFVPQSQVPEMLSGMPKFLVRTERPRETIVALREVFGQVPGLGEPRFEMMDEVVAASLAQERFSTTLMSLFAGLALLLTAVGIYGVLAYTVRLRTPEIGVRLALGAHPMGVLWLIVRQGTGVVAGGLAIGLAGAIALTRVLSSLAYGVESTAPSVYVVVAALLLVTAILASVVPALRASRLDPVIALRGD